MTILLQLSITYTHTTVYLHQLQLLVFSRLKNILGNRRNNFTEKEFGNVHDNTF